MFKFLLDCEDEPRASVQFREGLFILGARDSLTRRLIFFDRSNFDSESDAVDFFSKWIDANRGAKTTA